MCQAQVITPLENPNQLGRQPQGYGYLPLHPPRSGLRAGLLGRERFDIYPRLAGGLVYDDNVNLRGTNTFGDFIGVVSPGLTIVAGETTGGGFGAADIRAPSLSIDSGSSVVSSRSLVSTGRGLSLDYQAGLKFYAEHSELNAVDHAARLNAVLPLTRLSLSLQQTVALLSQNAVDTTTRGEYRTYQTSLGAGYSLSDLTSLQAGLNQYISDYQEGFGNRNWNANLSVNYALSSRISSGLGASVGYQQADQSPDQLSEQLRLLLGYEVSELVRLSASGGAEWRQFEGEPSDNAPGFVFDLSGTYAPTESTSISLSAGRSTQASSAAAGQNYTSTRATVSLSQQLFQRLACSVSLSYYNLDYSAAASGVQTSRTDDYLTARLGVGLALTPRISFSGFYQYRENHSSDDFGYENNQAGFFLNWVY